MEVDMFMSKKERMNILLDQISLASDLRKTHFINSEIEKLEVYQSDERWLFHITIDELLPVQVYDLFSKQLKHSFKEIATVDLKLYPRKKNNEKNLVIDYWTYFIQTFDKIPPAYEDLIKNERPELNNNRLIINVRNEGEATSLKRNLTEPFYHFCESVGLSKFHLETNIQSSANELEQFRKQTELEDREISMKMIQDKDKQQDRKNKYENNAQKLQLGYNIQDEP